MVKILPTLRLSPESLEFRGQGTLSLRAKQVHQIESYLIAEDAPRYAVIYNVVPAIVSFLGCSFGNAVAHARNLRRELCTSIFSSLIERYDFQINPHKFQLAASEFEVEGFGPNPNFMGDPEDFYTTKRLHFDIVEPLSSNLYGPNLNILGGFPVFADMAQYCKDNCLIPEAILEKLPGTRVLTIVKKHYFQVLCDYSTVYKLDMDRDTPFTIYLNSISNAGIMHGATDPVASNQTVHKRPLSHFSFDSSRDDDAKVWYASVGQTPEIAAGKIGERFLLCNGSPHGPSRVVDLTRSPQS